VNQDVIGTQPHSDEVDPGCADRAGQGADTVTFGRAHSVDRVALGRDRAHLDYDSCPVIGRDEVDLAPDRVDAVDLDIASDDL
jgi:hypothetical protein